MAVNLRNRSFVKELDFTPDELRFLLKLSADLKAAKYGGYEQPRLKGKEIALFKHKGKVCALYAHCPHQGGPLDEGGITDDGMVTCPWHGWEFNVENGECGFNKAIKQPTFPVKEEGDDVYVEA